MPFNSEEEKRKYIEGQINAYYDARNGRRQQPAAEEITPTPDPTDEEREANRTAMHAAFDPIRERWEKFGKPKPIIGNINPDQFGEF